MDAKNYIYFEFEIKSSCSNVWNLLSTKAGLERFFAPNVKVDFRVGGAFEILFDMSQPPGLRGSEGMVILNIEPEHMLSFTWNAPPTLPDIRQQMSVVHIYLAPTENGCSVRFVNSGYGRSESWQKARRYFTRAWGQIVLPRLKHAAEQGALQWVGQDTIEPVTYLKTVI